MKANSISRPRQALRAADTLMTLLEDTAAGLETGDINGLKSLTTALKDLRDIQSKAELDILAREAPAEESRTGVVLLPEVTHE